MSSALGSLVVKLALEYAEFTKGLDKSDQASLKFAQRAQQHFDTAAKAGSEFMSSMVTGALGAVAAVVSVGAAVESLNSAIDNLAKLDDLNQKTGSSIENLSRLQQVASAFGQDFGGVDAALSKLAKGMAAVDDDSNKTNKALKALGVSAKDSAGKLRDPSEVFVEAAKRLAGYQDGAAKAALVTDLLGKSGADLVPYMNDVAESIDKFQGVSGDAAANAAKFQDQLGMARAKFEALVTQIAAGALPAMNDLIEVFTESKDKADELAGTKVSDWADDAAVGLARVADVAQLLPRIFSAIAGSFKVVGADIAFAAEVASNVNPVDIARKVASGRNPVQEIRTALAERNAVLEEANKRWDDLWNKPANEMEQGMLKRIADRKAAASGSSTGDGGGTKNGLSYSSGSSAAKESSDYEGLNKALQQRLALAEREIALGRSLTASEKELAALIRGRAEGTINLTEKEFGLLAAGLAKLDADQRIIAGRENIAALNKQLAADSSKAIQDAITEAERNERLAETIGLTAAEIEAAGLVRLESQLAQRSDLGLTLEEIEALERLINAKRRSSAAASRVDELQGAKKGLDELNAYLDPAKAKSFGAALRDAFGTAGGAMAKMTSTLEDFGQRQAEIAKQRGNAAHAYLNGLVTEKEHLQNIASLNEMETRSRLAGYGDMASAAAGFFGEQSKGYQALMAVSKVFHAAELAMTLAELVPKGISAVLSQGSGDPYTAFGRMAAMAAIVTGLGVAIGSVGGGGSKAVAQDRQAAAGTGSVFGDSKAKSDSIARSLELAATNSSIELAYTAGMLSALRNIESSLAGLGNLLVRESGLTGQLAPNSKGSAYELASSGAVTALMGGVIGLALDKLTGGFIGKVTGTIANAIFGGKVTTLDTGFTANRTSLGSALDGGLNASQYTETKKDGGWFHSDKYNTSLASLGAQANDQITKVIAGLASGVTEAGKLLGVRGDDFTAHLNSFVVDIGKVSLKGLSGEQIQKQLEAVFSKVGDDMARYGIAGLDQFQKVGEGYLETLTRVAANYANLDSILASIGTTFGATGIASLAARERLIELGGGISELASKTNSFAENFLTEAERLAPVQKYVTEQLAAMGLASIDTREEFKKTVLDLVASGALATEAGAKQYAGLMDLEAAFAKTHAATVDLSKSQQAIADERANLMERLNAATKTNAELLAFERAALDASNQALYDQVVAAEAAKVAAERLTAANEETAAKRASIELNIAQLLGNTALARERELAALPESIRALQVRANALVDADQAVTSALEGVQRAVDAQKAAVQSDADARIAAIRAGAEASKAALSAAQKSVDSLKGIFDQIASAVKSLRGGVNAQANMSQAKSFIDMALSLARAGAMVDAERLRDAINTVTQDRREAYASNADFQFAQLVQAGKLEALGKLTGEQKSVAEQQFDALTAANKLADEQIKAIEKAAADQIRVLDAQWRAAQDAVSAMRGVDQSVKSVSNAISSLNGALAALGAARSGASSATGISNNLPTSGSVAIPGSGGSSSSGTQPPGQGSGASGGAPLLDVQALSPAQRTYFNAIKGQPGDLAEKYQYVAGLQEIQALASYEATLGIGMDPNESGDDYMRRHGYKVNTASSDPKTRYVPAFAGGGDHLGGLRLVGEDGPEIEATGPSRIWTFDQTRRMLSGGGNSEEVAKLMRMLIEQNVRLEERHKRLEGRLEAIAVNTGRGTVLLDNVTSGGNAMRTEVVKSVPVVAA